MRFVVLALSLLLASPALAETATSDERFSVVKTESGTIRVDRKSGAISYCRDAAGSMVCSMAADERAAWRDEMERMASRIDALEAKLAAAPTTPSAPAGPEAVPPVATKPTDNLDKAMDKVEGLMRRMIGVAKDVKKDWESN